MKNFGFGLMRLPVVGGDSKNIDIDVLTQMADEFIKAGGTYFDTAYTYHRGSSEKAIAQVLTDRYPRESFVVADKLPVFLLREAADMQNLFNRQLERSRLKHFDYYLLHSLNAQSYQTAQRFDAFGFAAKLKKEGKAVKVGFSFHDTPEVLDAILQEHPEVDFVQLQLNYVDWEDPAFRAKQLHETARLHGKPIIVMEPLKGGALVSLPENAAKLLEDEDAKRTQAEWGLYFAASLDGVFMVLSGMSTLEQVAQNAESMKNFSPLSQNQTALLKQAGTLIRKNVAVACTACGYCLDSCPQKIPIPKVFELVNDVFRFGKERLPSASLSYAQATGQNNRASDCLECGECELRCPQRIAIRSALKDAAALFES
jgi:predicted aldo/keto reductase-like oxidoreductase